MKKIEYKNHNFIKYLSEQDIDNRINDIAKLLNRDYKDKQPIVVGVLTGCVFFMMDLQKM